MRVPFAARATVTRRLSVVVTAADAGASPAATVTATASGTDAVARRRHGERARLAWSHGRQRRPRGLPPQACRHADARLSAEGAGAPLLDSDGSRGGERQIPGGFSGAAEGRFAAADFAAGGGQ